MSPVPVVAYVPDLMDRSRFAPVSGSVEFVRALEEVINHPAEVVILDLGRPGVIDVLPRLAGRRTVGFASHVDDGLIQAARAAGCEVLARSRFFARLPELVPGT